MSLSGWFVENGINFIFAAVHYGHLFYHAYTFLPR